MLSTVRAIWAGAILKSSSHTLLAERQLSTKVSHHSPTNAPGQTLILVSFTFSTLIGILRTRNGPSTSSLGARRCCCCGHCPSALTTSWLSGTCGMYVILLCLNFFIYQHFSQICLSFLCIRLVGSNVLDICVPWRSAAAVVHVGRVDARVAVGGHRLHPPAAAGGH